MLSALRAPEVLVLRAPAVSGSTAETTDRTASKNIARDRATSGESTRTRRIRIPVGSREGLRVLATALDGLRPRAGRVYVHLDLDVLDPAKAGRANEFVPEGGVWSMSSWRPSEWSADASTWPPAA